MEPEAERRHSILVKRLRTALTAGDAADAERALEIWAQHRGEDLWYLVFAFRLKALRRDQPAMDTLAERALASYPADAEPHRMAIEAALFSGDQAKAISIARSASGLFPADARLLVLGFRAARKADLPLAIGLAEQLVAIDHDRAHFLVQLGRLKLQMSEGAEALRCLRSAVVAGADERALVPLLIKAAVMAQDWAAAERLWERVVDPEQAFPDEERERARIELRRLRRNHKTESLNHSIPVGGFEQALVPETDAPHLFRSAAQDILCRRVPGSREAMIVFGGLSVMMGMARPVMTDIYQDYGMNILMFSDPRRLLMMGGAMSLGDDFAATIVALRRLLASWGVDRLYVVGASAGGFAALAFGFELDAHRILLLAPGLRLLQGPDSPTAGRLRSVLGRMASDVRSVIEEKGDGSEIIVAYDPDRPDTAWTEGLHGLANVRILPFPAAETNGADASQPHAIFYEMLLADADGPKAAAASAA